MKTVIEMANEAGLLRGPVYSKGLEKFAELVTEQANARANNSWTRMCEKMVAAEREACAKVCEEIDKGISDHEDVATCAAAIRARGNT